jgi:hypothetical protein
MRNLGTVDRLIRVVVGLAILTFAFVGPATPWALLGFIPLLTGLAGYCPAYHLLHFSTNPAKKYT